MGKNKVITIFIIDLIFIILIPKLSNVFTRNGSILDYLIPFCSSFICFLTIGILVGVLCIKKISQK
ncbi:hypothetical protein NSA50_06820 [Clostridium sp. DSM 100503]|uniref:hypothetical protein n=1 Tax=Clostridium sp. DSM 100503 TaxID=2963282 RepID=UPI00214A7403|nr:hypothetical protein [Clostridium sp. DSM 100503]MCR1950773.1 hypothetical protein [Clostridium sp. DSM 100503]